MYIVLDNCRVKLRISAIEWLISKFNVNFTVKIFILELMICDREYCMITVKDKFEGKIISQLDETDMDSARRILKQATEAFSLMKEVPAYERHDALLEASERVGRLSEEFAKTIAQEAGKPIKYSRKEVKRASLTLKLSAEEATRNSGETVTMDVEPRGKGRFAYYVRVPVGPVFSVTPFNDPLNLVAHKVGPAIAAGNSIINKPTTLAPLSSLKLEQTLWDAGLPENVFQNVISGGASQVTKFFLKSSEIRKVSFTGGYQAATSIISEGGPRSYSMELGSNSPVIVFSNSDWEEQIDSMVDAAFESQGQNCIHAQRYLIQDRMYDTFVEKFLKATGRLKVGNPLEEDTDIGPMITQGEAERVDNWVQESVMAGARVLAGGKRSGNIYYPTILENVQRDSTIYRQEVFGPVTIFIKFREAEDAFKIANDVPYGLQAGVFTNDVNMAMRAVNSLDYGAVLINDTSDFRIDSMPFGGVKQSGIGREGIRFAMESMTEIKLAIFRK